MNAETLSRIELGEAVGLPRGYHLVPTGPAAGIYFTPSPRKPDDQPEPIRVCGPLVALARTHDGSGHAWGLLLTWLDADGREHRWAMPRALLAGDGAEVRRVLLDRGLFVASGRRARELLSDLLNEWRPPTMVRVTHRTGWCAEGFVLPGCEEELALGAVLQTERLDALPPFAVHGDFEAWRQEIAAHAVGNSRLALALGAAFAAPLLELVGLEGGGFHLRGPSSVGKTTLLRVAGSVWGGGGRNGWVRSWRSTSNAVEATATVHSDVLLALDEIGEAGPDVGGVAYMLANGFGKSRAGRDGNLRRPADWRLLFLSTGEVSLAQQVAEATRGNGRVRAGQEVRVVDVPAEVGPLGVFERLPTGFATPRDFADHLSRAAREHYGWASRAWLRWLTAHRKEAGEEARRLIEAFVDRVLPAGASGQAARVAARFGLAAAGGEMATAAGVLPWPEGEALRAAATSFEAWLAARDGGAGGAEAAAAIAQVRAFLITHGASRFEQVSDGDAPSGERVVNRAGWKKPDGAGWRYIIPGEIWRREVCQGVDPEVAARACRRAGFLVPQSEHEPRHVRRERIGERLVKAYVIRDTILEGEE